MNYRDVVIRFLRERDGSNCAICGRPLSSRIEVDHVQPRSQGGDDAMENLQLTHKACNRAKGSGWRGPLQPFTFRCTAAQARSLRVRAAARDSNVGAYVRGLIERDLETEK